MVKVFVITQNEPFFIPKMVRALIENQKDVYRIDGVTVLRPHRKNKNYIHWFRERARVYSWQELIVSGFALVVTMILSIFKISGYSVKRIAEKNHVDIFEADDINSDDFIRKVEKVSPDVIISISCPQIFGKKLLNSVRYCINAHGTLLPRHRGVFGSWWSLYSGDRETGSTIHLMNEKLDSGDILWQKAFPVGSRDTQYSIAYKTKRDMATGLIETIRQLDNKQQKKVDPCWESSYNKAPTTEEARIFRDRKLRVIRLVDLKLVLERKFHEIDV